MKQINFQHFGLLYFCPFLLTSACQPPDVPVGGSYTPVQQKYELGDQVHISCDPGYVLMGSDNRTCQLNSRWTQKTPFCDKPTKLRNPAGVSFPDDLKSTVDKDIGTCVQSRKNTGQYFRVHLAEPAVVHMIRIFLPKGSVNYLVLLFHQSDGIKCGILTHNLEENQWVELVCTEPALADSVYIRDIDAVATIIEICEIEAYTKSVAWCPNPPDILVPNGSLKVTRERASLECGDGFRPGKFKRMICRNEEWVGEGILHCEEILCDNPLKTTEKGAWIGIANKLSAGTKKKLICEEGYYVSGSPDYIECLSNGTWTVSTAVCGETESSSAFKHYKPVIIATTSIVTIVVVICLILVIALLIKKKSEPVVVVLKREDGVYSEAEYAAITYDTIRTLTSITAPYPALPATRPPVALAGEYSKPLDRQHPPRYVSCPSYAEPVELVDDREDIDVDILKSSPLYAES